MVVAGVWHMRTPRCMADGLLAKDYDQGAHDDVEVIAHAHDVQ